MKNLKRKRISVITFLVFACLFIMGSAIGSYFTSVFNDKLAEASSQAASFVETYDSIFDKSVNADLENNKDLISDARLSASAAEQEDPVSLEPKAYGDGYIIKVIGDDIDAPDGFPGFGDLDASSILGEYDAWTTGDQATAYAHIRGPFYYVVFTPKNDSADAGEDNITASLSSLANANGCDYLYLESDQLTADTAVYVGTNDFYDNHKLSDTGLRAEQIDTLNSRGYVAASINGSLKWVSLIHPDGYAKDADILVFIDLKRILLDSMQQAILILIISMIILITLTVWIFSVYSTVHEEVLNEEQREKYNPQSLKRRMAAAMIASALIFFAASSFIFAIDSLFIESTNEKNILKEFEDRLDGDKTHTEISWNNNKTRYVNTAKKLAALLDDHRELQNEAWLQQAAEIIDADYITIYDTNGDEVISSSRYRGLSLGKDEKSATYDFRRLLRGVRNISHAGVKDEVTGLTRDMHGISLRYLSDAKSYGALLIAVDPVQYSATVYSDIDGTVSAMAPVEGFICGVDPETGIIKYSSDETMQGRKVSELCNEIEEYSGAFMGFVNIGGKQHYVRAAEHDGIVYYCGITQAEMFSSLLGRAFRSTLRFLFVAALLALLLFAGYNHAEFNKYAGKRIETLGQNIRERARTSVENVSADSGDLSRERNAFLRYSYLSFMSEGLSPGERTKNVLQFLIIISTVIISVFVFVDGAGTAGSSDNYDVIQYIAHGDWNRGLNLFSIAAILYLMCILIVGLYLLRLISGILYISMDKRAQTTFMLIGNIIRYLAIIIVILLSMAYIGVDTRAIIASAGFAGVAISLGAKDLIADIIAGINILADNTYQIGDIVSVGSFRGEVAEIGMRTTKIIGRGDNIKTIRNSSVGDVVNYSRLNSWYPLLLTIRSSQDLNALEKMLQDELPKISAEHPEMISGPEFRGVDSINGDKTTILILTECTESNYNQVQRDVNREVRELFRRHEIELL